MNNNSNIISKFDFLSEVISEESFHDLFATLIENLQFFEEQKQIELLKILAEKFQKFYMVDELTENEKKFISNQLIKWTNFSDLNRVCELTGLMFSFIDKRYYESLRLSLKTEKLTVDVKMEITQCIKEFGNSYFERK